VTQTTRLFGESGEGREVVFDDGFGDERAAVASGTTVNEFANLQLGEGLAHRQSVDAELLGQFALGWQSVAGAEVSEGD
jgi:hypothetical protein